MKSKLELKLKLETTLLVINIETNIETNIDTSFRFVSIILIAKVVEKMSKANTIKKNIFVFKRLERIAIKNYKK